MVFLQAENIDGGRSDEPTGRQGDADQQIKTDPNSPGVVIGKIGDGAQSFGKSHDRNKKAYNNDSGNNIKGRQIRFAGGRGFIRHQESSSLDFWSASSAAGSPASSSDALAASSRALLTAVSIAAVFSFWAFSIASDSFASASVRALSKAVATAAAFSCLSIFSFLWLMA